MAGVATSLALQDKFTKTLTKAAQGTNRILSSMKRVNVEAVKGTVPAMWKRTQTAVSQTNKELDKHNKKLDLAKKNAKEQVDLWGKVKGAVGAAAIAAGAKQLAALADKTTTTNARLSLMVDGGNVDELNNKIFASASRSRAAYQTTADAVSKMGIMAKDAFSTNGKLNTDELIAFTELINKQFTIAGTEASGIDAAMLQLTQAMSSGVLRGEELNSIFEQAPTIIQTIADYMGVPIGQIRAMAAEGQITSTIVKNAMLSSADTINERFNAMPMTFAQVSESIKNKLLQTFMPVIQTIGKGAQFINDNWATIAPILVGIAGGATVAAVAYGIWTAATWLMVAANRALVVSLLSNPFTIIAVAIGLIVGLIYNWIQSVGGLKIAWLIVCDKVLGAWDAVRIGLTKGMNAVVGGLDAFGYGFAVTGTVIQNFLGDTKVKALMILQDMVNGAIDIINDLISKVNKIPGISIEAIGSVSFGSQAAIENEAKKAARAQQLAAHKQQNVDRAAARSAEVDLMERVAKANSAVRKHEINAKQTEAAASKGADAEFKISSIDNVGEVGKINSEIDISDESLQLMKDVANMRYVQNFVTLTPTVAQHIGTVNQNADVDYLASKVGDVIMNEAAAGVAGLYT